MGKGSVVGLISHPLPRTHLPCLLLSFYSPPKQEISKDITSDKSGLGPLHSLSLVDFPHLEFQPRCGQQRLHQNHPARVIECNKRFTCRLAPVTTSKVQSRRSKSRPWLLPQAPIVQRKERCHFSSSRCRCRLLVLLAAICWVLSDDL
ncbi:hypothetical protein NEUTE2DRAFT_67963 [Neurospora tetrasperma FGSC 2509]|nr:hypothetical protein NEUTE2DRAFT_67963 [Neurospora tetrasperma FGSC 2509]